MGRPCHVLPRRSLKSATLTFSIILTIFWCSILPFTIRSLSKISSEPTALSFSASIVGNMSTATIPQYYPPLSRKPNAIVYMAQKSHKVYLRDSLALLTKSLDLLFKNYLLIDDHYKNVTVFLFHTGDFVQEDLHRLESRFPTETIGTLVLVNFLNSPYWELPDSLKHRNATGTWRHPEFNIGYRHMIRWYALRIYDYFHEINTNFKTSYQYIMRMDEESFLHSPIDYDLFQFMDKHSYKYAYRICSYEMNSIREFLNNYTTFARQHVSKDWRRKRETNGGVCGFYNNWFIARLDAFLSPDIQHMLRWFDNEGFMYRDRLNDLVIQSAAVYSFFNANEIHRFLDWTYEHFTLDKQSGCPTWGALTAGYNDKHANERVDQFVQDLVKRNCSVNHDSFRRSLPSLHVTYDHVRDLSPTYNHLSAELRNITLKSVKAGRIDMPNRDEQSG